MKKNDSKVIKYDFGCGDNKLQGYIGVDIAKTSSVDIVADLTKFPYSFARSNSADHIYSSHFYEHLDGSERIRYMHECYRILKVGEYVGGNPQIDGPHLTITVPYWSSMRSIQDPTHKWPPIAESSFLYFNEEWRRTNKLAHYPIHCDFDFTYGYNLAPDVEVRSMEYKQFSVKNYVNSISDIIVQLFKRPKK